MHQATTPKTSTGFFFTQICVRVIEGECKTQLQRDAFSVSQYRGCHSLLCHLYKNTKQVAFYNSALFGVWFILLVEVQICQEMNLPPHSSWTCLENGTRRSRVRIIESESMLLSRKLLWHPERVWKSTLPPAENGRRWVCYFNRSP